MSRQKRDNSLIQKVNRPAFLTLLQCSKQTESDSGSSPGGGDSYGNGPNDESKPSEIAADAPHSDENAESKNKAPPIAAAVEKSGMTEVMKELFEKKKETPAAQPGLTTQYSGTNGTAKGMLLNKKVY